MTSLPGQRYLVLDAFRFFAAFGIVFYHCSVYAGAMGWVSHPALFENLRLCVDFFFALSGFVLMHVHGANVASGTDYARFLQKRLARIYPLHAATVLAFVVLAWLAAGQPMATRIAPVLDPGAALPNLLLIHAFGVLPTLSLNFPSWSISAEWFLYLLFPALAALVLRIGPRAALGSAALFAAAFALSRDAIGLRDWTHATFDFGMLRALPSFVAGMAVCILVERAPRRPLSWMWVYAAALGLAGLLLAGAPAALAIALFPAFIGLVALTEHGGVSTLLAKPPFPALGDASYALYLLHALVMLLLAEALAAAGFVGSTGAGLLAAGTVALTILLSLLVFRFYEAPMRRWLSPRKQTYLLRPAASRRSIASE